MPRWVKASLWGTLAVILLAIVVPAALRTTASGLRGDLDPQVIEARNHDREVELKQAEAKSRIDALQSRVRSLDKILGTLGTEDLPTGTFVRVLPPCELEDGSTQDVCLWDGRKQGNGVGAVVINISKGKISFFPQTNGWVVN